MMARIISELGRKPLLTPVVVTLGLAKENWRRSYFIESRRGRHYEESLSNGPGQNPCISLSKI